MVTDPLHESLPIEKLRNLGPKSAHWLEQVGIRTLADLKQTGAIAAYLLVKQQQPRCSLNLLYALHGALMNVHWNQLSEKTRQLLRAAAYNE
ncbi:MAG: TfoX/Sxy family protein [Planctomycetes bacterium]|nr:TfoX/Sxy family protein [Planctomycetota bacterium]MCH9726099.1 TfoX/Sxy family protein [Planctomycetota bacterium]MCH9777251.1 TfoX/Sxy family protein [Planctomycetota bacterium]MCH9791308.1 TfoX/Sxy family protein [Planctomycetota bacterium]MDF1743148.1 TfoX/Sxy family protein [Gimesia sp.]